jgi:hypothetical protein
MSSLSDFALGGAVGAGTDSTDISPSGLPRGASLSLLPMIEPPTLGGPGRAPNVEAVLRVPSLTAGGVSHNSMATPRQLGGFLHRNEMLTLFVKIGSQILFSFNRRHGHW